MFGRSTSTTHVKYYKSIDDILLFNWLKCIGGEYQYARIDVVNEKHTLQDIEAWESIYSTYVDEFGLNQLYKDYLKKSKKLAMLQAEYILTEKRFHLNAIEVLQEQVEKIKKQMDSGITSDSVLVHLSKFMGYKVDPKKITAKEYFILIKEYERAN